MVIFPEEKEKEARFPKRKKEEKEAQMLEEQQASEKARTPQQPGKPSIPESEETIKKVVLAEMKAKYGEELPEENYPDLPDRRIRWEITDIRTYQDWAFARAHSYIAETQELAFDVNKVFLKSEGSQWKVIVSGSDTSGARGKEVPADVYDALICW